LWSIDEYIEEWMYGCVSWDMLKDISVQIGGWCVLW